MRTRTGSRRIGGSRIERSGGTKAGPTNAKVSPEQGFDVKSMSRKRVEGAERTKNKVGKVGSSRSASDAKRRPKEKRYFISAADAESKPSLARATATFTTARDDAMCGKWYSTEEWLAKAEERHGDRYEYPNFTYESSRQLIDIRCKNCRSEFSKQAHEHLRTRKRGSGCPLKCRDSKIHRIKDDEFLSVEYDHELNGPVKYFSAMVDPFWLPSKTSQSLRWICVDCNHSWKANRGTGRGCPSCGGKEVNNYDGRNSAGAVYPFIVNNWSEENPISPYEVTFGSAKYFLFSCIQGECENIHRSRLNNKVRAWYCKFCSNESRGRAVPGSVVWDVHLNMESLLFDSNSRKSQTSASKEVVKWKCVECSEVYGNSIRNQVNRNKPEFCSLCALRWVATNRPQRTIEFEEFKRRADEMHEREYEYESESYTKATAMVRMRHLVCDGDWEERSGSSHIQGAGCRACGEHGFDYVGSGFYYVHEILNSMGEREFYKGGISKNVQKRLAVLKRFLPEHLSIRNLDAIEFEHGSEAWVLERKLLAEGSIRHPPLDFPGGTELFTENPLKYAQSHGLL